MILLRNEKNVNPFGPCFFSPGFRFIPFCCEFSQFFSVFVAKFNQRCIIVSFIFLGRDLIMDQTLIQMKRRAEKLLKQYGGDSAALPAQVSELLRDLAAVEPPEIDFREIVENIDESVFIADKDGYVLYINPAYSRNTGVQPSDVLHKYVRDIIADGVFTGGATIPVMESKTKVYRLSTTYRSNPPRLGYTAGVPLFDEKGELKQIIVSSRSVWTLTKLQKEYPRLLSEVRSYLKEIAATADQSAIPQETHTIWASDSMQKLYEFICKIAPTDATVLLTGESGVGKEVVANEIYRLSQRSNAPFIKVNCAAIPANLLESELFGYEKGAFSGADAKGKKGLMEQADHGTLLLDEIGELPLDLQAKLLRVLQNKEIRRVGGTRDIPLDIRYIAATNCNLKQYVAEGRFRQDLYYRLHVIPIDIPPLRERREDIVPLCQHFSQHFNQRYHSSALLTRQQLDLLEHYSWPGNVRELENVIEFFTICHTGLEEMDLQMLRNLMSANAEPAAPEGTDTDMGSALGSLEKRLIEDALSKSRSLREAGKLLNISAPTLSRKIKQYGIDYPRGK